MFENVINSSILIEMLKNQYDLNEKTNGYLWAFGINKNGKSINWARTIYMELAELIDSSPWKHWKSINEAKNVLNEKIETSDIWHFLMSVTIESAFSMFLRQYNAINEPINPVSLNEQQVKELWLDQILPNVTEFILGVFEKERTLNLNELSIEEKKAGKESEMDKYMIPFEQLMLHSLLLSMNSEIDKTMLFVSSLNAIFYIIINKYIDIDLVTLYKGKCVLNQFRQDNGYAEGSYQKMWILNSLKCEDNVVMFKLLVEDNVNIDNLYEELKNHYIF